MRAGPLSPDRYSRMNIPSLRRTTPTLPELSSFSIHKMVGWPRLRWQPFSNGRRDTYPTAHSGNDAGWIQPKHSKNSLQAQPNLVDRLFAEWPALSLLAGDKVAKQRPSKKVNTQATQDKVAPATQQFSRLSLNEALDCRLKRTAEGLKRAVMTQITTQT